MLQVESGCATLRLEVLSYKGLSEQQVNELLAHEVQPVLMARQSAAQQLLHCAEVFLQRQADEWQLAVTVLSNWLRSLVSLFESHKSSTAAADSGVKAALRSAVQRFEVEDAAREASLATAVELLGCSSDEKELDVRLEAALQALSVIPEGYRAHAAAAISAVRAHPVAVVERSQVYFRCLCGLLHVLQKPLAAALTATPSDSDPQRAAASSASSQLPSVSGAHESADTSANDHEESLSDCIRLDTGVSYKPLHDLWQALLDATPKPWMEQVKKQFEQLRPSMQSEPHHGVSTNSTPAAPEPRAGAAGKMTKQQLAEAAAAEEAAIAAEEAAAAAAQAEQAALAAAAAQPPCPADAAGVELCLRLQTPEDSIREGLQALQVCPQ